MVVPFPAGGPSDVVARIVADQMGRVLGQTLVIENVGGAGGTLGSGRVATAAPDGYTLLAGSMGSHVAAPVLTPNIKYDSARDFVPIGPTAHSPAVIVARRDFPAKDLKEFVALLKSSGATLKQAHGGIGSSSHMACLLFTSEIGAKPTLVAYRGTGPAMNDLVGGHVDFFCEQSVSVAEQAKSGAIKAYAVSAAARLASLPDVPTAKEFGINYDMSIWAGIFAPKDTPAADRRETRRRARQGARRRRRQAAHQQSRRLDPREGGAQPGGVRHLCEGRDRALGAGAEGGGRAGEVAASPSPVRWP